MMSFDTWDSSFSKKIDLEFSVVMRKYFAHRGTCYHVSSGEDAYEAI